MSPSSCTPDPSPPLPAWFPLQKNSLKRNHWEYGRFSLILTRSGFCPHHASRPALFKVTGDCPHPLGSVQVFSVACVRVGPSHVRVGPSHSSRGWEDTLFSWILTTSPLFADSLPSFLVLSVCAPTSLLPYEGPSCLPPYPTLVISSILLL